MPRTGAMTGAKLITSSCHGQSDFERNWRRGYVAFRAADHEEDSGARAGRGRRRGHVAFLESERCGDSGARDASCRRRGHVVFLAADRIGDRCASAGRCRRLPVVPVAPEHLCAFVNVHRDV